MVKVKPYPQKRRVEIGTHRVQLMTKFPLVIALGPTIGVVVCPYLQHQQPPRVV